jgi:hypothetical protein
LRECFQESLLRGLFGLTPLAKESVGHLKHPRAEAANDFSERGLVVGERPLRQLEVRE